jgi:hypothetical protein
MPAWMLPPKKYHFWFTLLLTAVCAAVFLYGAAALRGWYIDDAVISFAYARNLAAGNGWVGQPGMARVEGFSNPLWTLLLALLSWLGADLFTAVKIMAAVFAVGVLWLAFRITERLTRNWVLALAAALWIALQPACGIWFTSGLENPLYAFLILLLVWLTLQEATPRRALAAGAVAALVGLTRPEGAVFLLIYLVPHRRYWQAFLAGFVPLYGGYELFRWLYFGAPLANTYYMKAGGARSLAKTAVDLLNNGLTLLIDLFGRVGMWFVPILLLWGLVLVAMKRGLTRERRWLLGAAGLALAVYLLLPPDWMKELRFATPFLVLFPILMAVLIDQWAGYFGARAGAALNVAVLLLALSLALLTATDYGPRLQRFSASPTVDYTNICGIAERIDGLAAAGGITDYSVLEPDAGCVLWLDRYRLIDLGGLNDAVIARTYGRDEAALQDYIFTETRPTILELAGKWAAVANLQADPRFAADYLPLYTYVDERFHTSDGAPVLAGIFVRRDLNLSADQVERMQQLAPSIMPQ